MKKTIIISLIILSAILISCIKSGADNPNRVYFSINPENRAIEIPISIRDSIIANMVFDTGAPNIDIYIDSSFIASYPNVVPNITPDSAQSGSAWSDYRVLSLAYNKSQTVKIGNVDLKYNALITLDWKDALHTHTDGIFNIPINDSTNVWELNFEHNYLEIHPSLNFKMPKNCILFPLEETENNLFYIKFSMQLKCIDGDTLTINDTFFIDTGLPEDVALMHPNKKESAFFNKKDAVWTQKLDGYSRYYVANANLFDDLVIDSLRIYTYSNPFQIRNKLILGLNFLKRFNVFFDMKNRQVGLLPINNFQRVVNPNHRRFHYSTYQTPEGKYIVKIVADYKENYFKIAGLKVEDEIVSINGIPQENITRDDFSEFYKKDTLAYDIIRNGKALRLLIPIDKTEKQGN